MCFPLLAAAPAAATAAGLIPGAAAAAGTTLSFGTIAQGLGLIGSVLSGVSGYQQSQAAAAAANYNAQQKVRETKQVREDERLEAMRLRRRAAMVSAAQVARGGASGAKVGGSLLRTIEDDVQYATEDLGVLRKNANRRVDALLKGASLDRAEASSARSAGIISLATGVIGVAGKAGLSSEPVSSRWASWTNPDTGESMQIYPRYGF